MLGAADLIICTEDHVPANSKQAHIISQRWFEDVVAGDADKDGRRPALSPDSPLSVYFTSGTTGAAKHMIQNVRMHVDRTDECQIRARFHQNSRFLVWPSFVLQGIQIFATACIRMGGSCVHNSREDIAQTISRHDVSHISIVPSVLANMVETLPDNHEMPENLTIYTFGGAVGAALRARAPQTCGATDRELQHQRSRPD